MEGTHWKGVLAVLAVLVIVGLTALPAVDNDFSAVSEELSQLTALEREGKRVYEKYCIGCHGVNGDGNGVSAKWLQIKPRNFQSGIIRFAEVQVGSLPRIEDYVRAIRHGLLGSSMPAWSELPDDEIIAVAHYLRTFAPRFQTGEQPGRKVVLFDDPFFAKDPATFARNARRAIEQGRKVYHGLAKCVECHPSYHRSEEEWVYLTYSKPDQPDKGGQMRDNPHMPATDKTDEYTNIALIPPDFKKGPVKAGGDLVSLARTIGAGVGGARMPAWAPTFRTSAKHYERFDGTVEEIAEYIDEDYTDYEPGDEEYFDFVGEMKGRWEELGANKFWALVYYVHALTPQKFGGGFDTPLADGSGTWGEAAEPPLAVIKNGKEVPGYTSPELWED